MSDEREAPQWFRTLELINVRDLPQTIGEAPSKAMIEQVRQRGRVEYYPVLYRGDAWELRTIDGNRRISALRAAGIQTTRVWVYCDYYTQTDVILKEELGPLDVDALTITLNAARSDNPATEAQAIGRMIANNKDAAKIAAETGETPATIRNRMKYANMHPTLRDDYYSGHIKKSVASEIIRCTPDQQQRLADMWSATHSLTATDVIRVREADERKPEWIPEAPSTHIPVEAVKQAIERTAWQAVKYNISFPDWLEMCTSAEAFTP